MNRIMSDRLAALEIRRPSVRPRSKSQIDAVVSASLDAHRSGACLIELPMERNRRAAVEAALRAGA
jgi:hypothetical protein